jgi:hypothetical protein
VTTRTDEYFVLREGATQEEQWTWDEIAGRCRNGEFTPGTRVFLPDDGCWVVLADTDLGSVFDEDVADETEDDEARAAREALEADYQELVEHLEDDPSTVEPWIDAGCLASELERGDEARAHFQKALQIRPFHPRVAQEVKRRFNPAECRRFQLLERPEAAWDNLLEIVVYPFARGPLYALAPAAVFAGLLFVPRGGFVIAELSLLWCYRCMCAVAAGRAEPVSYGRAFENPLRNILVPGGAMAAVLAEWSVVFWLLARAGMWIDGKDDVGFLAYIGASPVLTVAFTLCAIAYLPATMALMQATPRGVLRVLNPVAVARDAIRMRGEYGLSLLLLFALAVGAGIAGVVTGAIPVVGKLVWAASTAFVMLASAFVLGRLRARVSHLFG